MQLVAFPQDGYLRAPGAAENLARALDKGIEVVGGIHVAGMAVRVAQMTSPDAMRACFDAVTVNAARAIGLSGYGLQPGCKADFVRLRATRLAAVRGGKPVARSDPKASRLLIEERPGEVTANPCGA